MKISFDNADIYGDPSLNEATDEDSGTKDIADINNFLVCSFEQKLL